MQGTRERIFPDPNSDKKGFFRFDLKDLIDVF